jgi:hypothetical protein
MFKCIICNPKVEIQALEWVQGTIQDLVINNVTTDWPVYNDDYDDDSID